MGCTSSKRIEAATVDVYRPPPSSFAVFDINSIQEPWLAVDTYAQENEKKPVSVPAPVLEKISKLEADTPHSWEEVSRALEDLRPIINNKNLVALPAPPPPAAEPETAKPPAKDSSQEKRQAPRKSLSFHTVEELDAKISSKESKPKNELRKTGSIGTGFNRTEFINKSSTNKSSTVEIVLQTESGKVIKPVRENIFILRDKQEREKEGKVANFEKMRRFDPLNDYPEKIPPGGADSLVIYTTSLRGVRKTFEDCNKVKSLFEVHRVVFDERDVALHGGFLNELKELLGGEEEEVGVPRVFIKGRYIGGADKVVELNESGKLARLMSWARVERGMGRQACEGCGGARFVPCMVCGGSCKVLVDGKKERCAHCNENGLVLCPACL